MISPAWLRSFCTLVELENFTRTAEQLHMTQSGVSQHLRKLEERIGQSLVIREGKTFALTDSGKRLYLEAQQIVEALSNLEQRVGDDPAHEGLVRVMSPGSIGLKLYPKLLNLQQQYPKLIIDYRFAPNINIEQAIIDDRVDLGLMTKPSLHPDIQCQSIATESLLLITPPMKAIPSWTQLTELGFIDHPDGGHHANLLLSANYPEFEHVSLMQTKGFSNQIHLILEPVSRGLGFTVLPAFAVEAFKQSGSLTAHQLDNPISETIHLSLRRRSPCPNRVKTVIDEAKRWL